jgi:hypothetical protein
MRAVAKARRKTIVYALFVIAPTKTADKGKDEQCAGAKDDDDEFICELCK